jgi:hypothetical protein
VTGDATGLTMAGCNQVLTKPIRDRFLANVFMITAPHHGSSTTAFDLKGFTGVTPRDNIKNFATNVGAECISASAAQNEGFGHPSVRLLRLFWAPGTPVNGGYWPDPDIKKGYYHCFTAYFERADQLKMQNKTGEYKPWPTQSAFWTMFTDTDMFTNLYYTGTKARPAKQVVLPPADLAAGPEFPDPRAPYGVRWIFDVAADRTKEVFRQTNRKTLSAALVWRLTAPLPPPAAIGAGPGLRGLRVFP